MKIFKNKLFNWFLTDIKHSKMHDDEELLVLNIKIKVLRFHILNLLPSIKEVVKIKIHYFIYHEWKRWLFRAIILTGIIIGAYILSIKIYTKHNPEYLYVTKKDTIYIPDSLLTKEKFLYELCKKESGNNYSIESKNGMLGRYQFDPETIQKLGVNVSKEEFLSNHKLQDAAMDMLLKRNKKTFADDILTYSGTIIKGVYVTESGILAGLHLKPSACKDWLHSNGKIDDTDGNGTHVSSYIKKYGGYKIDFQ